MRKSVARVWNAVRHVLAARGLLQWTGWWETVSAAIGTTVISVGSTLQGLPWPVTLTIALVVFTLVSVCYRVWRGVGAQGPPAADQDAVDVGLFATHQWERNEPAFKQLEAAIGAQARAEAAPTAQEWGELEGRFERISGEVDGIWSHYPDTGLVKWSVHPRSGEGTPRDVQRFLAEAKTAGLAIRRMPTAPGKFHMAPEADPADVWLNAVAAIVDPATSMRGSGRDEDGDHTTGYIDKVVEASKVACARLAADSRK